MTATVVVMAKAPAAGRSKTRLCPPCTPTQAAMLAEAALLDTLEVVRATRTSRRVFAVDDPQSRWSPADFDVVAQRGRGLAERLSAVVDEVGDPMVIIGMDTPQVTPEALGTVARRTAEDHAQLGMALDGGWWIIGLPSPDPDVFDRVPMSQADTGCRQRARLVERFGTVSTVPVLRDVDHWSDALAVAGDAPATRFARAVRTLGHGDRWGGA